MPPNFEQLLLLPEQEMVAAQIYSIEQQIEEDLQLFPLENIKKIHYQSFSVSLINELIEWIGVDLKEFGCLPEFRKDSIKNIPSNELEVLTQISNKYSFPNKQYI